jgi:serine/threonine-protein kinase ATR
LSLLSTAALPLLATLALTLSLAGLLALTLSLALPLALALLTRLLTLTLALLSLLTLTLALPLTLALTLTLLLSWLLALALTLSLASLLTLTLALALLLTWLLALTLTLTLALLSLLTLTLALLVTLTLLAWLLPPALLLTRLLAGLLALALLSWLLALLALVLLQHGLQALLQLSGIIQRLLDALRFLRLACRLTRLAQRPLRIPELFGNLWLEFVRVLVRTALEVSIISLGPAGDFQRIARSLETESGLVGAQFVCRRTKLIRGSRVLLTVVVRKALELLLQVSCTFGQALLLLSLLASLWLTRLARSQLFDLFRGLLLLVHQLLKLLLRLSDALLRILRIAGLAVLTKDAARIIDGLRRLLLRLLLLLCSSSLLGIAQILDGLPKLLGRLSGLRIVLLAGHLLELTLHLFEITTQLSNLPLIVLRSLLFALLPLKLSLRAFREFLEFVLGFLFLCRLLLAFAALNGLVLVLVLIQFEFEKIGKVFGALLSAATAATAASLLDLDLGVQRCRFAEVVVRLAFDRDGRGRVVL